MSDEFDVRVALERIFDADTGIYGSRGFQRRVGFGRAPGAACTSISQMRGHARGTRSRATAWT